jgi:hypothetical protein
MRLASVVTLVGILMCCNGYAGERLIGGYTPEEAYRLGEQIFRNGLKPDGTPIQALLGSDIPMSGDMATCVSCHRRSGIGSVEGDIIAWPITGKELFTPRRRTGAWNPNAQPHRSGLVQRRELPEAFQVEHARPAYTDESLAVLIRTGVDPTGRNLGFSMPKFSLNDQEMEILVNYLKTLSPENDYSPGVDKETLRFATVITDDVSETDKKAMLDVLQAHVRARNTQTRPHKKRVTSGPFYKTESFSAYRTLKLDVWELKGEPDSWDQQLTDYYNANPVFGLLGGISTRTWEPIHRFSERLKIPTILPITDQPVVSDKDWYTLYFSKGYYQEGESVAAFIRELNDKKKYKKIIQIFDRNSGGELFAKGYTDNRSDQAELINIDLSVVNLEDAKQSLGQLDEQSILLLWIDAEKGLSFLNKINDSGLSHSPIFISAGYFSDLQKQKIPENIKDNIYLTHSISLPEENKQKEFIVSRWLQREGIEKTNFSIQAKMYFLGWMLPGALRHMRSEFYRDYFMERFDMMTDQNYAIAVYPRLTFASGQRYLAKGCYIVKLNPEASNNELVKVSDWITN